MKIPKARKLPSGNWFIQLKLGGESYSITERTEKACKNKARTIKAEHISGEKEKQFAKGSDKTLQQAIDAYIKSRDNILSPSTIRGYDAIRNNRFQDLMDVKLKDITDWQNICNKESESIKPKYLANSWGLIKSVLKFHSIDPPNITLPQVVKSKKAWIEPEYLGNFLQAIRGTPYETLILLALHGLRRSEILAIDESKIDFSASTIIVSGAVVNDRTHKLVSKDTNKNASSQRVVPIMIPRLNQLLREPIPTCYPNTIANHVNKACVKINIPPVSTQGLRRSFASLCYHLKFSERETMALGGWSDANVMRNIYIELAQRDKEKAVNKMSQFFTDLDFEEAERTKTA